MIMLLVITTIWETEVIHGGKDELKAILKI